MRGYLHVAHESTLPIMIGKRKRGKHVFCHCRFVD